MDSGLKTALAYGVAMVDKDIAVPATFVIDTNQRIVWSQVGESMIDRAPLDEILSRARSAR